MSEQIPAGWYPDPKDITSDPRPQRWWDGKGWTASTRPAPSDAPAPESPAAADPGPGAAAPDEPTAVLPARSAEEAPADAPPAGAGPKVLEGEVLTGGPSVRYPEPPPPGSGFDTVAAQPPKRRRTPSKLVVAVTVAALLGLGAGSGITFLAMDDGDEAKPAAKRNAKLVPPFGENGPWGHLPDFDGNGGKGDGNGGKKNDGKGDDKGDGNDGSEDDAPSDIRVAADLVNRITLPVPAGWKGGTTQNGFASLYTGKYECEGGGTCSLGGVTSGRIAGDGTDVQAAAKEDIKKAATEAYSAINAYDELKSEAVKVSGRDGWLVRWKVDAAKGNDGYVQTVVFPAAGGKSLVSLHFGFDIAAKAPAVSVMDTVVKGVSDYTGRIPGGQGFPGGGDGGGTT